MPSSPHKIAALALLAVALSPAAAVAQAIGPAARMATYNEGVVAVMKAILPLAGRIARFEALVRDSYDMPGITALVVGTKWAAATPAERDSSIAALTRHSVVSLAKNFVSFGGERFVIDPAIVSRGSSSIVKVTIVSKGRSDFLQYRMRLAGGDWRIIDVTSQGVSNLALQRAELTATIAAGSIPAMVRQLAKSDAASPR